MRPGGDFGTLGCKEHFATPLYDLRYLQRLWKETRESWTLTIVQISSFTTTMAWELYSSFGAAALHQDSSKA